MRSAVGLASILLVSLAVPVQADSPSNDDWADAAAVTGPFSTAVDAAEATREPGEPDPPCTYGADEQTVWYDYEAAASGTVTVSYEDSDVWFESYPSVLVLSQNDGVIMACQPSLSVESLGEPRPTSVTFDAHGGYRYFLRFGSGGGGPSTYAIAVTEEPALAAPSPEGLPPLIAGNEPYDRRMAFSLVAASVEALPFTGSGNLDWASPITGDCVFENAPLNQRWYSFVPATTTPLTITSDQFLMLYGGPASAPELLGCNVTDGQPFEFRAHAGVEYLVAVVGYGDYTVDFAATGTPAKYDDRVDSRLLGDGVKFFNSWNAMREPGEAGDAYHTLWFRYDAPGDGLLHVHADHRQPAAYFADFETVVQVYDAMGQLLQSNDGGFLVAAEGTYEIQVGVVDPYDGFYGQYRVETRFQSTVDAVQDAAVPDLDLGLVTGLVADLLCLAVPCDDP